MAKNRLTTREQAIKPEEAGPLGNLPGLLRHLAGERPVSLEEMDESIRERMREKFGSQT
jgi:hypothetical protein